jgi:hypothetical protein
MAYRTDAPAIELAAIAWDKIGETDPANRMLAHIRIAGLDMHLEARQVEYDGDGNQGIVDFSDDYDHLSAMCDCAFTTVEIEGREYLLYATPYGK